MENVHECIHTIKHNLKSQKSIICNNNDIFLYIYNVLCRHQYTECINNICNIIQRTLKIHLRGLKENVQYIAYISKSGL